MAYHSMHVQIYQIAAPAGCFQSQIPVDRLSEIHEDCERSDIRMVLKSLIDFMSMISMMMTTMKTIQIRTMNSNQQVYLQILTNDSLFTFRSFFVINGRLRFFFVDRFISISLVLESFSNHCLSPICSTVNILGNGDLYVRTSRGVVPRRTLKPNAPYSSDMLPSDTGSRIGMIYVQNPSDANKAEMHFIVNGEDQGPCTKDIPYKESELYAVIDIYGTTKQVKIIQLYESECHSEITSAQYTNKKFPQIY